MTTLQDMLALMGDQYVVGMEDNYASIANATGTNATELYNANGGANLNIGMSINVPQTPQPAGTPQMDPGGPAPIYPPGYTPPQPAGTPQMDPGSPLTPQSPAGAAGQGTGGGGNGPFGMQATPLPTPPQQPQGAPQIAQGGGGFGASGTGPATNNNTSTPSPGGGGFGGSAGTLQETSPASEPSYPTSGTSSGTSSGASAGTQTGPITPTQPNIGGIMPEYFEKIEFLFAESLLDIMENYGGVPPVGPNGESLYIPDYIFRENNLGIQNLTEYDMIQMGWVLTPEGNWVYQGTTTTSTTTTPGGTTQNYGYGWHRGRGVSYPSYSGTNKSNAVDWRISFA